MFCQQPLRVLCDTEQSGYHDKSVDHDQMTTGGAKGDTTVSSISCFERAQSEGGGAAIGEDGDEDEEDYTTSADSQTLVRMLEDHEKVGIVFPICI